ncbi:RNA polymerase sigma factor [Pedobacter sp. AW1-32]|uniref:RNA polymerase sigma factor n=1 Tax=Pedobacter sp. AW1-32 TaxID=3383026 RepID=UPI003FEFD6FC
MNQLEFSAMVKQYAPSLKAHALNFTKDFEDANDLIQDTLVKALRFYNNFEEGTNFKGWLFVIMKNTFINNYRKESKTRGILIQDEEISYANLMTSAQTNGATSKIAIDDITKALNLLPDVYRIPFVKYFEGYKYHEIAEEYDIPLGTVKTRIHMAREMLKKQLKTYAK